MLIFEKSVKEYMKKTREVVRGEWRKLHNEEINTFIFIKYHYGDCIREN